MLDSMKTTKKEEIGSWGASSARRGTWLPREVFACSHRGGRWLIGGYQRATGNPAVAHSLLQAAPLSVCTCNLFPCRCRMLPLGGGQPWAPHGVPLAAWTAFQTLHGACVILGDGSFYLQQWKVYSPKVSFHSFLSVRSSFLLA